MTSPSKASPKISYQDKKDLEKYIKFFTFKFIQVVVQARCGEKFNCRVDPKKPHWFNLAIEDVNEITKETSKALGGNIPCFDGHTVNVELSTLNHGLEGGSFKTAIEVWSLDLDEGTCFPDVLITHGVYNKLGILLKSMLCISRLLPGYKTSLNEQGSESFIVCYNIYLGEPDVSVLDTNYKTISVGKVATPMGSLNLRVHHRTSLSDGPRKDANFADKFEYVNYSQETNHHSSKGSPQGSADRMEAVDTSGVVSCSNSTSSSSDLDEIFQCDDPDELFTKSKKVGAFVIPLTEKTSDISKEDFIHIPEVPFMSLLSNHLKNWSENEQNTNCDNENSKNTLLNNSNNTTANETDVPSDREVTSKESEKNSVSSLKNGETVNIEEGPHYDEDDFVHVILKTPFAKQQKNELAEFIHECQQAPVLKSFLENEVTLLHQVDNLNDKIEELEVNAENYNCFVKSLHRENEESD